MNEEQKALISEAVENLVLSKMLSSEIDQIGMLKVAQINIHSAIELSKPDNPIGAEDIVWPDEETVINTIGRDGEGIIYDVLPYKYDYD